MAYPAANPADRFWSKVGEPDENGCWPWLGAADGLGYGHFFLRKVRRKAVNAQAYRFAWELMRGMIPAGLTLDHLCRNPRCVNPDHLEPVTQRENVQRGFDRRKLRREIYAAERAAQTKEA